MGQCRNTATTCSLKTPRPPNCLPFTCVPRPESSSLLHPLCSSPSGNTRSSFQISATRLKELRDSPYKPQASRFPCSHGTRTNVHLRKRIRDSLQVSTDYLHLDSKPLEGRECHCIVVSASVQQITRPGSTVFTEGTGKRTKGATADGDRSWEKYKCKWEHGEGRESFLLEGSGGELLCWVLTEQGGLLLTPVP